MWTRAHYMCPYHRKTLWSFYLCDSYCSGLQHKQARKFILKFI
jgi:hypothetical protein